MNIKTFLRHHPMYSQADALKEITKPLEKLGINYFSQVRIDNQKNLSCFGNDPHFANLYFEKGYQQYDLHMLNQTKPENYILWDLVGLKGRSKDLHQDFINFNLGHTFNIIYKNQSFVECYHFATTLKQQPSINQMYLENLDVLKQFISYFKDKVSRNKSLLKAYDLKIPLQNKPGSFDCLLAESNALQEAIIQDIVHERLFIHGKERYLTKSEANTLYWLSKGKTLDEVAILLTITERTVKAHIAAIKEKFNYQTLFQLGMLFQELQS